MKCLQTTFLTHPRPQIENIRDSWRLYLGSQREKDRKLSREAVEVARDSIAIAKNTVEKDRDM